MRKLRFFLEFSLHKDYNNTRKKIYCRNYRPPCNAVRRKQTYMNEPREFLVPDYFKHFSCKMGDCRSACCQGWPITITMKNYFTLLGMECGAELRDRLDRSMHLVDRPSEDEYARFSMRWDGECALRLPDGRCSLHAELGPEILSDVCDLYPRGIRTIPSNECSCAGSCEAVLELLIRQKEPLTFARETHTLRMPRPEKRLAKFETLGRETEIRLWFIRIMQDRSLDLPHRLGKLGDSVYRMDAALQKKDEAEVEFLLKNGVDGKLTMDTGAADTEHLLHGLGIVERMIERLDGRSDSIRDLGEAALAYFGTGAEALKKYESAKEDFENTFPDWEIFFEHMLVNHMFFSQFPYQDRPEKLMEEFIAFCAVYILLRFLTVGCMVGKTEESDLIDICAALFRLVEHTEFDRIASRLLRTLGCTAPEDLWSLISL